MLKSKSISKNELGPVENLLRSNKLCFNDINETGVLLYGVEKDGNTIGYYGFEIHGEDALFRSMIVSDEFRGHGFGSQMVDLAIDSLSNENVTNVYLLTTTAADFFSKKGFKKFNRSEVPEAIGNTNEFKDFCPDSSVCMHLKLN